MQGFEILIVLKLQLEKFEGTQSVLETKWQEQLLCVIISVDREVEDISWLYTWVVDSATAVKGFLDINPERQP